LRLRVYLDTSVISAYFDTRRPERQAETRAFWRRLSELDVTISEVTEWNFAAQLMSDCGKRCKDSYFRLTFPVECRDAGAGAALP
jgi:predicted nucleic acid-binding protein